MSDEHSETVDLLVVGSGAAALTAAVTAAARGLDVLMVEKSALYGGTTAMSGGTIWIPCNRHMPAAGIDDSAEDARTYLRGMVGNRVPERRLAAYLEHGPRMVDFLEARGMLFTPTAEWPDYYPERPGGKPGARTLEAVPFDAHELPIDVFRKLRLPHPQTLVFGRLSATSVEARALLQPGWRGKLLALSVAAPYALSARALFRFGRSRRLTLGNALVARLLQMALAAGVRSWLDAPAIRLVTGGGAVTGAVIARGGTETTVHARRGVILGAGGFDRDLERRAREHPGRGGWSAGSPSNSGDGLRLGEEIGAATDLLDDAWWMPVTLVPGEPIPYLLVTERGMPGSLIVNRNGRRFTNESAPYLDMVRAIHEDQRKTGRTVPCFMVFDRRARWRYPFGPILPAYTMPDALVPTRYWDEVLFRAPTIEALAEKIDVDPSALVATVRSFNEGARRGVDHEFHRGESLYDRYYSDLTVKPNPTLRPLERGPFYALPVWPGDLGTKGGLVTNEAGCVLRSDGTTVRGLYAAGNVSSSVMGTTYPAAGATIGPAMVFGYLAALHAAGSDPADSRP